MLKVRHKNTGFLCYPNLISVNFDLFINFHDLEEYGNYLLLWACMLATLKIEIKHSITNPGCKTDICTLINMINKIK